jgi:hypothetical protein
MTTQLPSPSAAPPPGALPLLAKLEQHHIEYVLIGGIAAAVHGAAWSEDTIVIVPARFERNLDRLARALRDIGAKRRDALEHESLALNRAGLRQRNHWTLYTDLGALEIDFEPPATAGHLDLFQEARRFALAPELGVEVAALADLIRIAEMRRSKADEAVLPVLRAALSSPAPVAQG